LEILALTGQWAEAGRGGDSGSGWGSVGGKRIPAALQFKCWWKKSNKGIDPETEKIKWRLLTFEGQKEKCKVLHFYWLGADRWDKCLVF
jgi:hypothetical protein